MNSLRRQDGFAIVTVLIVMLIMIGLGIGMLLFANTEQHASARTASSEAGFNLAEASLDAEMFQLSRVWPGSAASAPTSPAQCTPSTSSATNFCPDPSGLSNGYPVPASATCPGSLGVDAWGAPAGTQWATYVRDNGPGTNTLFNSTAERTQPTYDANGDGKLWVRAVGVAGCTTETVVALVSQQLVPLAFPTTVLSANWFATGNSSGKIIVNARGTAAQNGFVSTRCTTGAPSPCQNFSTGQISPYNNASPPRPSPAVTATQLASVKSQAQAKGTYFTPPNCPPSSITALNGAPTYVEGCGTLSYNNGTANSAGTPGWLVLADGTIDFNGNATFYGTIYAVNGQNSSGIVVNVHGNALIQGAVDVDGPGGVGLGQSKMNLIYDTTSFGSVTTYAGVTQVPNSFRLLPAGQ